MTGPPGEVTMAAMRGRPSGLLPIEAAILELSLALRFDGQPEFHGFLASARLKEATGSTLFVTHGALYKGLNRLETRGYLQSRWEEADLAGNLFG